MSNVKKNIGYFIKANCYLSYFFVMQSVIMMGVFCYKIFMDMDFQDLFYELMAPIYLSPDPYIRYDEAVINLFKLLKYVITDALFLANLLTILFVLLLIRRSIKKNKTELLNKINKIDIPIYLFSGFILNAVITFIVNALPKSFSSTQDIAIDAALSGNPILMVIGTGILAPIVEELIFRYGMQKNLCKINVKFGIIAQAIMFGICHGNLAQGSYAICLGLLFGIVDYKTNSIWPSILAHIAVNFSSAMIFALGVNETVGLLFLSLISILVIIIAWKNKKILSNKILDE